MTMSWSRDAITVRLGRGPAQHAIYLPIWILRVWAGADFAARSLCYSHNMAGKKAVLNVTVDESVAADVRGAAAAAGRTVSSVVEEALAEQLARERTRLEGLAAIDTYYQEHGYPTPEEEAAAEAWVAEEERRIAQARAAHQDRSGGTAA